MPRGVGSTAPECRRRRRRAHPPLQEAKPYKNDPDIIAMTNLVSAYMRNEIRTFEKLLKQNSRSVMGDAFIRGYIEDLLKNIRTQVRASLSVCTSTAWSGWGGQGGEAGAEGRERERADGESEQIARRGGSGRLCTRSVVRAPRSPRSPRSPRAPVVERSVRRWNAPCAVSTPAPPAPPAVA